MKKLKISKYHIYETIPAIRIYYLVFLLVISLIALSSYRSGGSVSSSGLEMASVVFLFICGLNSFKSNFKFSQANNVSRKTFFIGVFIGVFPITLSMSIFDLIINRVYNIFVKSPTNFDMIFGTFRGYGMSSVSISRSGWIQANDLSTLFGTFILQFALYTMVFFAGILISLIYYRCNNLLKIVISILPVILMSLSGTILRLLPESFLVNISNTLKYVFGLNNYNYYIFSLSIIVLGLIFAGFIYLLSRRAIVKE